MGRRPNARRLGAAIAVLLLPTAHLFEVLVVTPSALKSCLAAKYRFSAQVDVELFETNNHVHQNSGTQITVYNYKQALLSSANL